MSPAEGMSTLPATSIPYSAWRMSIVRTRQTSAPVPTISADCVYHGWRCATRRTAWRAARISGTDSAPDDDRGTDALGLR